jgi:integrase
MTKRTRTTGFSYMAGEKGRNRVRVFEKDSGILVLEYRDGPKRVRRSLGHRDREKAKAQADQVAAEFAVTTPPTEEVEPEVTLGQLFDMYEREVTPTKSPHTQKHDRRAMEMFVDCFGADRSVRTLSIRDHERFISDRREGRIPAKGGGFMKPVGNRMVEQDLRLLNAIFNWATVARDDRRRALLARNPFRGFKVPKEKNPLRVVLTDDEYDALLSVAKDVDWRFYVALVLAHETGHRIGAIRQLRWCDVDLDSEAIHWPPDTSKTGYAHTTPLTEPAVRVLEFARSKRPAIGEAPVLPSPLDPARPSSRHIVRDWWKKGQRRAGLEPKRGRGWHSLRRKFASDLMHKPLRVLCDLGGWKEPQTILKCYQRPDQDQLREALADRRRPGTAS